MFSREPRSVALTLLFHAAIAAGWAGPTRSDEPRARPAGPPSATVREDATNPAPPAGRMFVVGRVLDPAGKPVPGAAVMVHARSLSAGRAPFTSRSKTIPLAEARTDGSARFRIDAPRTSSTRHEEFGAVALAPGYGAGWVMLDPDDDQPTAEISLRPEQVIHGRLFGVDGRPVPDARVSVRSISIDAARARSELRDSSVFRRFNGVSHDDSNTHDIPAWPRPTTTDSEGRFTLRGIGRDLRAGLAVFDPRFARARIEVKTDDPSGSKALTAALVPSQILTVRQADRGGSGGLRDLRRDKRQ